MTEDREPVPGAVVQPEGQQPTEGPGLPEPETNTEDPNAEATAEDPNDETPASPFPSWFTPPPQPEPWKPSPKLLDPNRDDGWEAATAHELIAIRPEDIPPAPEPDPEAEAVEAPAVSDGAAAAADGVAAATDASSGEPIPFPGAVPVPAEPATPRVPIRTRAARSLRSGARATRTGLMRGIRLSVRPVLILALFTVGLTLGWLNYNRMLPVSTGAPVAQAVAQEPGTTETTPPQVLSLLAALNEDDQSLIQTVVPAEPYRLLAGELAARGISSIRGSRAMSTYVKGQESATEILISGVDSTGGGTVINLVVHISGGVITSFR